MSDLSSKATTMTFNSGDIKEAKPIYLNNVQIGTEITDKKGSKVQIIDPAFKAKAEEISDNPIKMSKCMIGTSKPVDPVPGKKKKDDFVDRWNKKMAESNRSTCDCGLNLGNSNPEPEDVFKNFNKIFEDLPSPEDMDHDEFIIKAITNLIVKGGGEFLKMPIMEEIFEGCEDERMVESFKDFRKFCADLVPEGQPTEQQIKDIGKKIGDRLMQDREEYQAPPAPSSNVKNSKQHIIIINGSAESGKDEFCKFVQMHTTAVTISTVDMIKQIAHREFVWDGKKDEAGRQLLSDLKDASTKYNNGPFKYAIEQVDSYKMYMPEVMIFIHCREPEEIQKLKDHFGEQCTTLLVRRPGVHVYRNHADLLVSNFKYDTMVTNDKDLKSLEKDATDYIEWLNK